MTLPEFAHPAISLVKHAPMLLTSPASLAPLACSYGKVSAIPNVQLPLIMTP